MTPRKARQFDNARRLNAIDWMPAQRLGQLSVDAQVRPWLIGKGLLSERLRLSHAAGYSHRLVAQWSCPLGLQNRSALQVNDENGLFRDVEMLVGDNAWVYEQSVTPDSTLSQHTWLAELGDAALGETIGVLSRVERSSYEYAWLPAEDALTLRALRDADVKPTGLWGRRCRVLLRGAPLLVHELFLPAMGRA